MKEGRGEGGEGKRKVEEGEAMERYDEKV